MLLRIRKLHLYLGTFFAPAFLFFALTGAFQTLGWQQNFPGSASHHPEWIAKLAQIHKNQQIGEPKFPPGPNPFAGGQGPGGGRGAFPGFGPGPGGAPGFAQGRGPIAFPPMAKSTVALKAFVVLMALGLMTTTLLGIYMSFKYNRDQRVVWALLILGIVIPVGMLYI